MECDRLACDSRSPRSARQSKRRQAGALHTLRAVEGRFGAVCKPLSVKLGACCLVLAFIQYLVMVSCKLRMTRQSCVHAACSLRLLSFGAGEYPIFKSLFASSACSW